MEGYRRLIVLFVVGILSISLSSALPACMAPLNFRCDNDACIPAVWKCDTADDCGDNSDEVDCGEPTCAAYQFQCDSGQCIFASWECDGAWDCEDKSDEANCGRPSCAPYQFQCDNGWCIFETWECDGTDDCQDKSDEANCSSPDPVTTTEPMPMACGWGDGDSKYFQCHNDKCIVSSWECDGMDDCGDNSDEADCDESDTTTAPVKTTTTPPQCGSVGDSTIYFQCNNGNCIVDSWKCDGMDDCGDNSDEVDCVTEPPSNGDCRPSQFACRDGGCISGRYQCDGDLDCGPNDTSDEENCHEVEETPSPPIDSCPGRFACRDGGCIPLGWRCDGGPDCADDSDEENCPEN